MDVNARATHRCFGGTLGYYEHAAQTTGCTMRFSLFLPPAAEKHPVPLLFFLSGLTCTEDNFTTKAGAYRTAAELGMAIVAPDTSPRGDDVPDQEGYDIGQGAGFYLDATESPWDRHYRMYSYLTKELPELLAAAFPVDRSRQGICGHSMGGHGALVLHLRNPELFKSVSALAPIVAPMQCAWGQKAFSAYLGPDVTSWRFYDAACLMQTKGGRFNYPPILIDQGLADPFLSEQLKPELFEQACADVRQPLELRRHEGYDHSYFFIQTFIDDHLRHHAAILKAG